MELALDAHAVLGESPTWSARERALYWIDIKQPALHRFDPATSATRQWPMPDEIGCFTLCEDGSDIIVALRSGLYRLDVASGALTQLAGPPYDPDLHRFNEGGCDKQGRFWLGTMFAPRGEARVPQEGALYYYTGATGLVAHRDLALTPNGLAWSADGTTLYFAHTKQHSIYAFAFEAERGRLGKRLLFATVPADLGLPDGAAVDMEGCYWSAIHGGGRLHRYRPNGVLDREVPLPVSRPTMCTFGGSELDELYVTSASDGMSAAQRRAEPHAGGLFRFRPGVRGLAKAAFAG